MLDSIFVI